MIATLLVSGCAPPTPSIWRGSGEPMAASSARSRSGADCGRPLAGKYSPLDVPPRIRVLGMARMPGSLRQRLRTVDQSALGQLVPHVVDIDAQFPLLQPLAHRGFLGFAGLAGLEHGCSLEARNHAHTVVVRDHHVTGIHEAASTNHRNIHRSQGLLYGSLRVHGPGPDREAHAGQVTDVPDTGIDDQTAHGARGERACKQLAEIAGV